MSKASRRAWTDHMARHPQGVIAKATAAGLAAKPGPLASKFRNVATLVDGIRFASKLEADRYRELKVLQAAGGVAWFLRQVPFEVAPRVVYRADFLVVWAYGAGEARILTVEDCKGMMTPNSRTKIAVVEQRYGIKIKILTRADVSRG